MTALREAQARGEVSAACDGEAVAHFLVAALEGAGIYMASSELAMVPSTSIRVEGGDAQQVLRLVEMLEEHDDVQHVWANFDIDDATLAESA